MSEVDQRILNTCEQFRAAFHDGRQPTIEEFIQQNTTLPRGPLLCELLRIEIQSRSMSGDVPRLSEYEIRFAADREVVTEAFHAVTGAFTQGHVDADKEHPSKEAETVSALGIFSAVGDQAATPSAISDVKYLGDFKLLEILGQGGMGTVYRARQRSVDRIVAVKLIRSHREEAIGRFQTEAQAVARLEHDHIVPLYEFGEAGGVHYLAMRYVDGTSLAEKLRDGPLGGEQSAGYLEPVARAVFEAHRRGVLHRDIKPQNILIDDETGRPLVTDFGLAKVLESETALTQHGEVMGTPQYMSPEQARNASAVNALTDVYSLGATLYHLLTGRPPFVAATAVETVRQVISEQPASPRRLNSDIPRDLDTICLKCLEKEPDRRYESAAALADELKRFLEGKPIEARPIGAIDRSWRWCRRNRELAVLAATAAVFLIVALVASTVGYIKTSAAQRRDKASFREALRAVDDLFTRVSEETLLDQPGMQPLKEDLLRRALDYYQRFLDQRGDDPLLLDEIAGAHFRIGLITLEIGTPDEALAAFEKARSIQSVLLHASPGEIHQSEMLGNTLNGIGRAWSRKENSDRAREAFLRAAECRKELVDAAPENVDFRRRLANVYMNLGILAKRDGNLREAIKHYESAQQIRAKLLVSHPGDMALRRDVAIGDYNLGNLLVVTAPEQAKARFRAATAEFERILEENANDLNATYLLGISRRLIADLHNDAASIHLYQQARAVLQPLAAANPDVVDYQVELAAVLMNQGERQFYTGAATALETLREALVILNRLHENGTTTPKVRRNLAMTLFLLAQIDAEAGNRESAEAELQRSHALLDVLVGEFKDPRDQQVLDAVKALLERLAEPANE